MLMSASKKRVREEGWKLGCGRKKVGMGFVMSRKECCRLPSYDEKQTSTQTGKEQDGKQQTLPENHI
jgi:hypothetical protein